MKDMRDKDILYLLIRGRPVYLIRGTKWRDEEKRYKIVGLKIINNR